MKKVILAFPLSADICLICDALSNKYPRWQVRSLVVNYEVLMQSLQLEAGTGSRVEKHSLHTP